MSVIKAYSSNSAKVGIDGVPLAGVELAEEYERHSEYPVLGFGDCVPSAILTFDRSYEIVLERTASIGDGVRLENAEPFAPISVTICPAGTSKLMPLTASMPP